MAELWKFMTRLMMFTINESDVNETHTLFFELHNLRFNFKFYIAALRRFECKTSVHSVFQLISPIFGYQLSCVL